MLRLMRPLLLLMILIAAISSTAIAQEYPSKRVRIVVPFGAGTGADSVARILAERLSASMAQPFIVENRVGAGGAIGTAAVASSLPDGYTLLMNASSHTSLPALYKNLPFNSQRDFVGIAVLATSPMVLVASTSKGWHSVKDLIAAAKAKPGSLTFASAGVGSTTHLTSEKFCLDAGISAVHIPYKSTTDAIADVLTGRTDFLITSFPPLLGLIKDGRLVPLAMGAKRSADMPNVPTFTEVGVREAVTWFGLFASSKTPHDIIVRLHKEVAKAADSPAVQAQLAKIGAESVDMTIEQFDALLKREFVENANLVKKVGLKLE